MDEEQAIASLEQAGIGHNQPPPWFRINLLDGKAELDLDAEKEHLRDVFEPYRERLEEIRAGVSRAPAVIDNEADSKRVIDFITVINGFCKLVDTDRKARREPFARAAGVIQTQLQEDIIDVLARDAATLNARLTDWQRRKAAEERRQREEEARRRAQEADRARQAALEEERRLAEAATPTEADLTRAIEADQTAQVAEADAITAKQQASVKPAELSRERAGYGGTASLHTTWVFAEDEVDWNAVDKEKLWPYISADSKKQAVRAFIRAGNRELDGVRIFQQTKSRVR
jgi:hypothetical protein